MKQYLCIFIVLLLVINNINLVQSNNNHNRNNIRNHNRNHIRNKHTKSLSFNKFNKNQFVTNLLQQSKPIFEQWLTVQSEELKNVKKYPLLVDNKGNRFKLQTNEESKLINQLFDFSKNKNKNAPPSKYSFYARLINKYLYFTTTKNDNKFNTMIFIHINTIKDLQIDQNDENCIIIFKKDTDNTITICGINNENDDNNKNNSNNIEKLYCYLRVIKDNEDPKLCIKKNNNNNSKKSTKKIKQKIITKKIEQPYIIIPIPQQYCNHNWNYEEHGKDWECMCKEGNEQSPIDLPEKDIAEDSPTRPVFDYKKIEKNHKENIYSHDIKEGTPVKIEHKNNALRIFYNDMGKVVTPDGTVYKANEIAFHTPTEHKINGESFPMEMQIVHKAITKGDIGKSLILSFMFKPKAGVYNKFIDEIEFFNLPNPHVGSRVMFNSLYIPNILLNADEEEVSIMNPFSFFTYSGSLTQPPCSERVIHYVASDPIEMSITALELFKEALRMPDFQDRSGNVLLAKEKKLKNNRETQALNGRKVFHYNHTIYNCPEFRIKKDSNNGNNSNKGNGKGHYEKQEKEITEYVFVNSDKPSNVPNSVVVSEEEAQ